MGKLSLSKRSTDRRLSKKDIGPYTMSDINSVDSNSDSGLDVGGPDSESRDEMSPDEPYMLFKNPSIASYENAMDKLLLPILQAHRAACNSSEPAVKKARMTGTMTTGGGPRLSGRLTQQDRIFTNRIPVGANYADLLLEEANLECPEREVHQLPQLQNVLKNILSGADACNGTQDLTMGQPKSETSSKAPPQSLQTNDGTNGNNRGGTAVNGANSGSGRRVPLGRRQLTLCLNFPSKSKGGQVELRILSQPEEQHRARYLTEGSRGAVKDRIGSGYPTVKLFGYCKPVNLQVFIGTDQGKVQPHLFYQASKVCGKNSAPCNQKKIDGTVVLELSLLPEKDMTLSCDCIGILKERNVDVEQRLLHFGGTRSKKRSTRCRLVFRALISGDDGSVEILQVASAPIVCTQPPGIPEICRKSLCESAATGNVELFVIGKNFLKDTEVVFEECSRDNSDDYSVAYNHDGWKKVVIPEKDFLQPNHLICTVPAYHDTKIRHPVRVRLLVQSSGKRSEPQNFTYLPVNHVACPLPGLAPLPNCVNDTAMGLVQQPPAKTSELLPTLIQLPLAQPHRLQQQEHQQKGTAVNLSPRELKQENGCSQQMLITTLVIPSSAEGTPALSQEATTRILQENQHAIQTVAISAASSSSSAIESPLKTSHIQVLVMPSSSTVSVTTAPRVINNSPSLQDSIINSLKTKISMCNTQSNHFSAPKEISFGDVNSKQSNLTVSQQQQQTGLPICSIPSSFTALPKDLHSIQDLLLHGTAEKQVVFENSTKQNDSGCSSMALQNSLQNNLGGSLENIPIQSLIQTTSNKDLQTIQDLLLNGTGKRTAFEANLNSVKLNDPGCSSMNLQNSIQNNNLGGGLENIPIQSFIQTNSNTMAGANIQQSQSAALSSPSFLMNSDSSSNFSTVNQKEAGFTTNTMPGPNIQQSQSTTLTSQSFLMNTDSSSNFSTANQKETVFTESTMPGPTTQQSQSAVLNTPSFLINTDSSSNFSAANQKEPGFTEVIEKSNTNTMFHMEQSIIKHEPKDPEISVTSSCGGFELSVNNVLLNPNSMSNPINASSLVQNSNQVVSSMPSSQNLNDQLASYYAKDTNLAVNHDSNSQPAHQNESFQPITMPNPILANALVGVNLSESGNNAMLKSFTEDMVRISLASENNFHMPATSTLAPSLGKCISISESQFMNFVEPFPKTVTTSSNLGNIVEANSNSSLNFQERFQMSMPTTVSSITTSTDTSSMSFPIQESFLQKELTKSIIATKSMMAISENEASGSQILTNSEINFMPATETKESTQAITESSLVPPVNRTPVESNLPLEKSNISDMALTSEQVSLGIQDLNTILQDTTPVTFQNLNTELAENSSFIENRSVTLNLQQLQDVANSLNENNFQSSNPIQSLQTDILTSVSVTNPTNQTMNFSGMSEPINLPTGSAMQATYTTQNTDSVTSASDNRVTFSLVSDENSMQGAYQSQNISSIDKTNMSFSQGVQNVNVTSEQSIQGPYSEENLTSISNLQDTVVTFTTGSQNISLPLDSTGVQFVQQNLGTMANMQNGQAP